MYDSLWLKCTCSKCASTDFTKFDLVVLALNGGRTPVTTSILLWCPCSTPISTHNSWKLCTYDNTPYSFIVHNQRNIFIYYWEEVKLLLRRGQISYDILIPMSYIWPRGQYIGSQNITDPVSVVNENNGYLHQGNIAQDAITEQLIMLIPSSLPVSSISLY